MNKSMAIKWITWKKWTDSLKSSIFHNWTRKKKKKTRHNPIKSSKPRQWSKISPTTKDQEQMASQGNSKHLQMSKCLSSKTRSKNCRGRNTSTFILWGYHHPDTKTRQGKHEKRKVQVNITDEHRCKKSSTKF